MKHTIFTTLFIFTIIGSSLLDAQRPVLVEHFTNTWCPICASRNPSLYETIAKYPDNVVHIAYHIPVPYNQCILYQANKPDQEARMNYYNVYGSPSAFINGTNGSGSKLLDETKLTNAIASAAPLSVTVTKAPSGSPDGLSTLVNVNIKANSTVDAGNNARIFVLVAERTLDYTGPNGESTHPDVFRKFLTSNAGDVIGLPQAGNTVSMSYSYDLESGWIADQIYPIAFIQNIETKTVYAAGSSLLNSTTGVHEFMPEESLQIYPNPADNQLFLQTPMADPQSEARIFALSGQLVQTSKVHDQRIDVSNLAPGMYVLRIQDHIGRFVKR